MYDGQTLGDVLTWIAGLVRQGRTTKPAAAKREGAIRTLFGQEGTIPEDEWQKQLVSEVDVDELERTFPGRHLTATDAARRTRRTLDGFAIWLASGGREYPAWAETGTKQRPAVPAVRANGNGGGPRLLVARIAVDREVTLLGEPFRNETEFEQLIRVLETSRSTLIQEPEDDD
jgi:hypothetical protein